jgi:sulfur transfer complex TusBCD TusB component (DsrH family)
MQFMSTNTDEFDYSFLFLCADHNSVLLVQNIVLIQLKGISVMSVILPQKYIIIDDYL